ncbi:MAG: transglycosylase domain-containing protein, partial [Elusimicrobiota bacterium]
MKKYVISTAILVLITGCYIVCSRIENSSFTSKRIYDRNMILMREICASEYGTAYPIKLSELPRYFIDAVIVTEDKRFYSHIGLDILAVLRAIKQNIYAHRVISGGSTITQQLVRNMYHYPRTVPAKVVETVRAVCIEIRYSKARILEEYLNRIPYGNGAYGVESAARLYFGKPAKDLSLAESAFLCAIPASNKLFNPYKKRNAVFTRQRYVLAQLYRTKKISETEYNIAGKEKLVLYLKEQKFIAPHFCNWVLEKYKNSVPDEIITTLDCDIQNKTEFIVKNHIARLKNANVNNAAVVVVENTTRDVIALVGSSDFFDELNSGQVNGALALRQPGSAIKPFVYGLAFEQGNTPADTISDIDSSIRINENSFFNPQNYDKKYHGPVRLRTALACSYNIATTNLAAMFGTEALLEVLHRARFDSLKNDAKFYGPGLCLGTGEVTLAELARAYCALAMGGRVKELRILKNEPSQEMGRVFKPETAYLLTDILSDNNAREPAFGEFSSLNLPFDCAVKTGTSKNFRDNWTVGYTPRYTVAVW